MTTGSKHGIPTRYREARFRSRLEGRWAAFFDLVEWSWVYEPFDTDGWIPDFLIAGSAPFLVEVGPCIAASDFSAKAAKAIEAYPPTPVYCERIDHESCRHADDYVIGGAPERLTLVLGVGPMVLDAGEAGYLTDDGFGGGTGFATWARCRTCEGLAIMPAGARILRPCGHGAPTPVGERLLFDAWNRAGSLTQWRPPVRRPAA